TTGQELGANENNLGSLGSMLTEDEIRKMIEQKSETKNLDYKESLNWRTSTKDERLGVAKDLLAMANTQDGGRIVFGIRDENCEFIGMPEADWESFDTTTVNEFV